MPKAIIINYHDDDGIIGMGGTLIQLLEKGWRIMYIQMTDGRHGSNKISPNKLRIIRAKEAKEEREFLGIDKFYNFDIEDGTLGKINRKKRDKIIEKLIKLIEDLKPNIVFLPGKTEAHIDHRATYQIGREAIKRSKIKPLEVYYCAWFFPFLKQDPGAIEKVLRIPIDKQWKKKRRTIRLHTSQEKEGGYSQLVEGLNVYFSLIYSPYRKKTCNKVEVLAVHKVNKNYELFVKDLEEVGDVTKIFHGRKFKKIQG
ncbi:PIG-L family deacetylase [Patescibacteria group bacterium]|nr:PIG-L family deacetylase [Patescibacteria group bacterium]